MKTRQRPVAGLRVVGVVQVVGNAVWVPGGLNLRVFFLLHPPVVFILIVNTLIVKIDDF